MPFSPLASPVRKTIVINTASQLLARLFSSAATFIVSILLIRYFGILSYGDFVKITTFVAPFYLLADFGSNAVFLQNQASKKPVNAPTAWFTLLSMRFFISLCLMFIILLIVLILPKGGKDGYTHLVRVGIILFAPSVLFQATITTANAAFQKHLRYYFSAIATAAGSVVNILSIALLLFLPKSASGTLYATLGISLGSLTTALISILLVKKLIAFKSVSVYKSFLMTLFKKSLPLALTLVFNLIYFRLDTVILTLTRSTSEVGVYGFIYKIFEVALVFPTFFMNALYPLLLKNFRNRFSEFTSFNRMLLRASLILSGTALIVLGMYYAGSQFLPLIDKEFYAGIVPFRILTFSLPFFYLSSLTMWLLITYEKQTLLMVIYGISMALNFLLNIVFVPRYGLLAAALTTFSCEGFVLVLSSYFVLKELFQKRHFHGIKNTFNSLWS